jgi:hypothetical protein
MCIGEFRNEYKTSVGKPEGRISPWRYRHKWEDNTKLYGMEIGFKDVN